MTVNTPDKKVYNISPRWQR